MANRRTERLNEQLGRKVRDRDSELAVVRAELGRERGRYDYTSIVGASEGMRRVFQQLDRIIESELPVFIQGESGTGKELIARAIHFNGARRNKPFVTENCAALPDTLLESELFGHTRGAFTGAHRAKKGLLEQADGGTLFLDEIAEMSFGMQSKLLRALESGEIHRVGDERSVVVDVRVPPSRSNSCSCSTRRILACVLGLMSPTSSRNSVPPSACSNRPMRCLSALVNEPFSWPNSSDSSSSAGIAPQFTATKGRWRRGLAAWIARAAISFPVPDSPSIRTVES